jgi:hypothetical protein
MDDHHISELSEFDDTAVPLPQETLAPTEVRELVEAEVGPIVDELRKKDLRFTTVEGSPPTQTDSLALAKLSQYVEEPNPSSSNHITDLYDFEVSKLT